MNELVDYLRDTFKVSITKFLDVLQTNPNARQNIHGIIGEVLFKEYAESKGYEVLRIKEKPEGGYNAKNPEARGDFYIKNTNSDSDEWFVVECKSVKTNAEKRSGLTDIDNCVKFLYNHSVNRPNHVRMIYRSGLRTYMSKKRKWELNANNRFPNFVWNEVNPGSGIPDLTGLWDSKEEIIEWIRSFSPDLFSADAFWNLEAPIRLLQTHMPSTRIDPVTKIKSTGPLKTEFNILCVDLFLKTNQHEFVFANAMDLNHQAKSPNHLQQNYSLDILVDKDSFNRHLSISPWYTDIDLCITETNPVPRKLDPSQLDLR